MLITIAQSIVPVEITLDLSSLLIALVGAAYSGIAWIVARKRRRQRTALLRLEVRREWERDVRPWAEDCVMTIQAAYGLTFLTNRPPTFFEKTFDLLQRMQGLIDTGRWLFPNNEAEHGSDKYPGFQGLAHMTREVLKQGEALVRALNDPDRTNDPSLGPALLDVKKRFVAEIHKAIDPVTRNSLIDIGDAED